MKKLWALAVVVTLALTACAEGSVGTDDDPPPATLPSSTTTADTTTATGPGADTDTSTTVLADEAAGNDAFDALVERITSAPQPTSGRMEVTVSIRGIDDPDSDVTDASLGIVTAFDTATNSSSVVMDLSALASAMTADPDDQFTGLLDAFAGEMEVRQIGDTAYIKMPLFNELLGADTPWLSMSADEGEGFTSDFSAVPADPEDVMTAYDGADVVVEEVGREQVNGAEADHYRLTFDTTAWLDALDSDERADLEASGLVADGVFAMDVWIADDGQLVRLVVTIDGAGLDTPQGGGFDSTTIRYDLVEVGQPVVIDPPPAGDVTPIDDIGFADFGFTEDA